MMRRGRYWEKKTEGTELVEKVEKSQEAIETETGEASPFCTLAPLTRTRISWYKNFGFAEA